MYRKFFGLKKKPFILTPDPQFLYFSKTHDLAITHLEYGIVQHLGFLVLTGEVGAGKTTLLKYLFDKVKDSFDIAMLFNTNLDPHAFLEMLVREFGLKPRSRAKPVLFNALANYFIQQYSNGNRCVIIVDEAQNLPDDTFEELRMLSNLEVGDDFIVQVILVGQPQLRTRLSHPSLSQLAQRVSVHFHLTPLPLEEVNDYIEHRLKVAGYEGSDSLFDEQSIKHIAALSKGIPRVINSICDACLTYAFAEDKKQVNKAIVDNVIKDNELLRTITEDTSEPSEPASQQDVSAKQLSEQDPFEEALARIREQIAALEVRVNALESSERNVLVGILHGMLVKERERGVSLEKKIVALGYKCKELVEEIEQRRKQLNNTGEPEKKPRKIKNFFRQKRQ